MAPDPDEHVYSDSWPHHGEDFAINAAAQLEDAARRFDEVFARLRLEVRGKVQPFRYEAWLRRLENLAIEMNGSGRLAASTAHMRMSEFEDELAATFAVNVVSSTDGSSEAHIYREDTEGYGEYAVGVEENLRDTSLRLERLHQRLRRDLRGKTPFLDYEWLSGRVARAKVTYRGSLREAQAAAERSVLELRAEIKAAMAELES